MTSSLPQEVLDLVSFKPLEDLTLTLLREKLGSVSVNTLVSADQAFPLVIIRRGSDWGRWSGDARFVNTGTLEVHTFADGLNADEDAALLGEACRVILRDAVNRVVPGLGHFTRVDPIDLPHRVSDWATATGPVQYADLPNGVERYEALYEVTYRRPV